MVLLSVSMLLVLKTKGGTENVQTVFTKMHYSCSNVVSVGY